MNTKYLRPNPLSLPYEPPQCHEILPEYDEWVRTVPWNSEKWLRPAILMFHAIKDRNVDAFVATGRRFGLGIEQKCPGTTESTMEYLVRTLGDLCWLYDVLSEIILHDKNIIFSYMFRAINDIAYNATGSFNYNIHKHLVSLRIYDLCTMAQYPNGLSILQNFKPSNVNKLRNDEKYSISYQLYDPRFSSCVCYVYETIIYYVLMDGPLRPLMMEFYIMRRIQWSKIKRELIDTISCKYPY